MHGVTTTCELLNDVLAVKLPFNSAKSPNVHVDFSHVVELPSIQHSSVHFAESCIFVKGLPEHDACFESSDQFNADTDEICCNDSIDIDNRDLII